MDSTGMGERMANEAGMRPWWPLVEASPRWVRVRLGPAVIADTRRALLHVQYGPGALPEAYLPTYYIPRDDVSTDVLVDQQVDDAGTIWWTVQADGRRAERAAWMHSHPEAQFSELADHVTFSWDDLDWYEEDEHLIAHARDPHKRVDVAQSSRHVQVEIDGQIVADSIRPLILFETTLPPRYYLPHEDVRTELLESSETTSMCPYKGVARYWSARVGDRFLEDVVWSYPEPIAENPRIEGLLCFLNEKVDLVIDDERLERPLTPWS